jgi:hypothetical protein
LRVGGARTEALGRVAMEGEARIRRRLDALTGVVASRGSRVDVGHAGLRRADGGVRRVVPARTGAVAPAVGPAGRRRHVGADVTRVGQPGRDRRAAAEGPGEPAAPTGARAGRVAADAGAARHVGDAVLIQTLPIGGTRLSVDLGSTAAGHAGDAVGAICVRRADVIARAGGTAVGAAFAQLGRLTGPDAVAGTRAVHGGDA